MVEKMQGMSALAKTVEKSSLKPGDAERAAIREMVKSAKDRGLALTGPDGLLKILTSTVLETALDEEMNDHLGYVKHAWEGRDGGNSRNGVRSKTVITDTAGPVEIAVPRDRDGSFEPQIVKKRQRRLGDVDTIVLSLYSRGLTTGEISAHFAEVYGASVSKDAVSTITDRVLEEVTDWSSRPLLSHYVAVFVDAIHVKVRDGQVANRPFYAAIGVDLAGRRDVLGLWAGTAGSGESSKFWLGILTELKNRGVVDIFYLVCDGLKGMPDSVNAIYPATIVQTCIVHLVRNTFKYASKKYWGELAKDVKAIYTAANAAAAWEAFEALEAKWGKRYPAICRLWRNAWDQFVPFLDYDIEIRRVLCSTNAIESMNARYRRAVDSKGHFPTETAALKTLYLVTRSLDPKGTGQQRWMTRWKPVLNVLAIVFADRMPDSGNL
jgi:transposase-like protein